MRDRPIDNITQKAQKLEQKGNIPEALQCLLDVGAVDHAVQLLARHQRFVEAARLRLQSLGAPLKSIHKLSPAKRQLVLEAASYLEQGDEWSRAASLYHRLKLPERASQVLKRALLSFVPLQKQGPIYREACLRLIQLAVTLDHISFEIDHILNQCILAGPQSSGEFEFFYQLGQLYLNKQQFELAERVLKALLQCDPHYRNTREMLAQAYAQTQHASPQLPQLNTQNIALVQRPTGQQPHALPQLHDLPLIPSSPVSAPAAYVNPPSRSAPTTPPPTKEELFPMLSARIRNRATTPPPPTLRPLAPPNTHYPGTYPHRTPSTAPPSSLPPVSLPPPSTLPPAAHHRPLATNPPANPFATSAHLGKAKPVPLYPELLQDIPAPNDAYDAGYDSSDFLDPASQTDISATPPLFGSNHMMPGVVESDFFYHFSTGSTINERYQIIKQIGQGGMAAVFCAYDSRLEEQIALKVFDPFYSNDNTFSRFTRELKLSRKLSHPNIVRLHDIGSHQQYHYISMELLRGEDLESIVKTHRTLSISFGVEILLQACEGLQAAHDLDVIHRDIKPSNFFLTDEGVLKLMDFGIAIEANTSRITATGNLVGTSLFMAPERAIGERVITPASDLYSIGVMAFEMFTGQLPFYHDSVLPLLMMHVQDPPPNPMHINPDIPELLAQIILKLLAKKPQDRYANCRALASDLRAFLYATP